MKLDFPFGAYVIAFVQVSRVSKLRHENFVELLGYCKEGNLRILAYEFATMGSLHDVLHGMINHYAFLK